MREFSQKLQRYFESKLHMVVLTVAGAAATIFSLEHYIIPLLILLLILLAVLDRNFTDMLYPLLLLNAVALRTAGQTTILLKHVWLAVPAVIAVALHFVIYARKITVGKSFYPLCAVSAALLLGGVGVISLQDYLNPGASLYYILFLGIGMMLFYIWMRNYMFSTSSYDLKERILEILYFLGIFCAFSMLEKGARMIFAFGEFTSFKWSNDICEMMLFALPVPFYFARRHFVHFFVPFLFYLSMIPTLSISALVVGGVILALGVVYAWIYIPQKRLFYILVGIVGVGAGSYFLHHLGLLSLPTLADAFALEENGRVSLFTDAWQNFLHSPLVGVGIGYGSGQSAFMGTRWTHNWVMQIVGSMGVVGVLAYGWQTAVRARLIFKKTNPFRLMIGLSYFSIFLISMLQPGEFCPMPYELLAVCLFTVLEITENEQEERISLDKHF